MTNVHQLNITPQLAKQIITDILAEGDSRIIFTKHAKERMEERAITRLQVKRCLQHGLYREEPSRGVKGNWEFSLSSVSAGDNLVVAAALDEDARGNKIIVITTYWG